MEVKLVIPHEQFMKWVSEDIVSEVGVELVAFEHETYYDPYYSYSVGDFYAHLKPEPESRIYCAMWEALQAKQRIIKASVKLDGCKAEDKAKLNADLFYAVREYDQRYRRVYDLAAPVIEAQYNEERETVKLNLISMANLKERDKDYFTSPDGIPF